MSETQTEKATLNLQKAIDSVLLEMENHKPHTETYAAMVDQLEKLYKIKSLEKDNRVNLDSVIAVAGNLAGIIMILGFERAHVVTSKALGFVLKSRV